MSKSDGALLSRSKNGFSLATAVQSWLLDQYFTCATGRVGVRSSVHSLGNRRVIQTLVPGFFFLFYPNTYVYIPCIIYTLPYQIQKTVSLTTAYWFLPSKCLGFFFHIYNFLRWLRFSFLFCCAKRKGWKSNIELQIKRETYSIQNICKQDELCLQKEQF